MADDGSAMVTWWPRPGQWDRLLARAAADVHHLQRATDRRKVQCELAVDQSGAHPASDEPVVVVGEGGGCGLVVERVGRAGHVDNTAIRSDAVKP